jgi:hypothetical protein
MIAKFVLFCGSCLPFLCLFNDLWFIQKRVQWLTSIEWRDDAELLRGMKGVVMVWLDGPTDLCLEGARRTMKKVGQDSRYPSWC